MLFVLVCAAKQTDWCNFVAVCTRWILLCVTLLFPYKFGHVVVDSNSFSLLLLLLFTFGVVAVVVGYSVWFIGIFRNGCCVVALVVFAPMLNARVVRCPCCF